MRSLPIACRGADCLRRGFPVLLALLIVGAAAQAAAASLHAGLQHAESLASKGDWDGALDAYHALQVEHPNEDVVLFGLGCAQYRKAEGMPEGADPTDRGALYTEAQSTFERLTTSSNAQVAADAAFNRANCVAQKAAMIPDQQAKPKTQALRQAIAAYEAVLASYPEHAGARKNLDHVRYSLRLLQQNMQEQKNEDNKNEQSDDKQPPEPPQQIALFTEAQTEIPGAKAVVSEDSDTVQLVQPGTATEAQP